MKPILIVLAASVLAGTLTGCVVTPVEPVHYGPPAPPVVVVHPAHRHYPHHYGPRYRYWR